MKRIITLLLAVLLMFAFAGCAAAGETDASEPSASQSESSPPESAQPHSEAAPDLDAEEAEAINADAGAIIYPRASTSKYLDTAKELEDLLFHTTGAENGFIGTIYRFEGEVVSADTDEVMGDYITVETPFGKVVVTNFYEYFRESEPDAFLLIMEEESADYSFPAIGEHAGFICMYSGFSAELDAPTFNLGANEFHVEITLEGIHNQDAAEPSDTELIDNHSEDEPEALSGELTPESSETETISEPVSGEVWVTKNGKKYHSSSSCSNMKSPIKMTIAEAKSRGYTACSKCY